MEPPVYFDNRWHGQHGIGRFSIELERRIPGIVALQIAGEKLSPVDPIASSIALAGKRQGCFLSPGFNPPLRSPIPFAFGIYDLIHLRVPSESTAVRRLYYATVVRPGARRAQRILTCSEYSRTDILEWAKLPPESVRNVGAGVSPLFVPAAGGLAERQPYLLHVGRRETHKNIRGLLQAFKISRARAGFRLVFTGNADAPTQALLAEVGLSSGVSFAGQLTDEALVQLYQRSTAVVFPSLHEGFGLPIVEGMATATPVITSNCTSMPDVAGEGNALLVDPRDPAAIAQAMDRITSDQALWHELSVRGPPRAREFTWEKVCARVMEALELAG